MNSLSRATAQVLPSDVFVLDGEVFDVVTTPLVDVKELVTSSLRGPVSLRLSSGNVGATKPDPFHLDTKKRPIALKCPHVVGTNFMITISRKEIT